jgi:hypothetical protein
MEAFYHQPILTDIIGLWFKIYFLGFWYSSKHGSY